MESFFIPKEFVFVVRCVELSPLLLDVGSEPRRKEDALLDGKHGFVGCTNSINKYLHILKMSILEELTA